MARFPALSLLVVFAAAGLCVRAAEPIKPDYVLRSIPENSVFGYFAAETPPVLKVKSGDIVEMETVTMFGPNDDAPEQFFIENGISLDLPVVKDIIAFKKYLKGKNGGNAGNIMTGPVYVEGAEPGDTLEVRVVDIKSRAPYGVNSNAPGRGGVPDLVPRPYSRVIKLDLERNVALYTDNITVPLGQFQGRMGVAPPPDRGRLPSSPPYPEIGGNMDNRHLGKGATLYFPVHVPGALFQTGDPHASQGNGEVGQSALESSNTVTVQFILRKDLHLKVVQAETATHYILMGMHPDLNIASRDAIANTIEFLQKTQGLTFFDSLTLSSIGVDFEVTQVVDGTKGIHSMVPKSIFKTNDAQSEWYKTGRLR